MDKLAKNGPSRRVCKTTPPEQRFAKYVPTDKGADECWEWTGAKGIGGYGRFNPAKGYSRSAHIYAWELANAQKVPKGLVVMHSCDNPACCNPRHLSVGTHQDNQTDATLKGHKAKKLTAESVQEIRRLLSDGKLLQREIADLYGVNRSAICSIKRGTRWGWLKTDRR